MALSQLQVVHPGDAIQSAVWNNEFQNILTNPIALISPSTGAINFALQSHTNLVPSAITATSGSPGSVLTVSTGGTSIWAAPGAAAGLSVAKTALVFTATSTTYTPSSGVASAYVQLWGPGGGGSAANGATNQGGAGGSGGYASRVYVVTTSMTVTLTLPVGGTGGTVSASSGVTGAAASFASSANPLTANGGAGGGVASTGGAGGTASGGTLNFSGWSGQTGDTVSGATDLHGAAAWFGLGMGGYGGHSGLVNATTGQGFSAGGGGGGITGGTGGAGAPAVCIIWEYA